MMLPTLYSRRSDGKVQTWSVEIVGDKYRFISGIKDGAMVESEWTIATPMNVGKKNATTAEDQALKEAKSHWKKKVEKGYYEKEADIDIPPFVEPMLAKNSEDFDLDTAWDAQPKLDGIRCLASENFLQSRNGKPFLSIPHIAEDVKKLIDHIRTRHNYTGKIVFDGELYNHELRDDFNKIVSLSRKTSDISQEDLNESKRLIEYHVYDIILEDKTLTFSQRIHFLRNVFTTKQRIAHYIELVPTRRVKGINEVMESYTHFVELGYEGQMLRVPSGIYEHKRSKNLLKQKSFKDEEFEIVDILPGLGNRSSGAGAMLLKLPSGAQFKSGISGTQTWRDLLLRDKKNYIGKLATVKYFALTPDGIPRFPVMTKIKDE